MISLKRLAVNIYCLQSLIHFPPRRIAIHELLQRLANHGDSAQIRRVIDVGCGPGLLAPVVTGLGLKYIGVDSDAMAIEHAGELYSSIAGVSFLHLNALDCKLEPEPSDIIVLNGVAHHLSDDEMAEVMKRFSYAEYLIICDHAKADFRFPVYLAWLLQQLDKGRYVRRLGAFESLPGMTAVERKNFWISFFKIPLWPYFANLYRVNCEEENEK